MVYSKLTKIKNLTKVLAMSIFHFYYCLLKFFFTNLIGKLRKCAGSKKMIIWLWRWIFNCFCWFLFFHISPFSSVVQIKLLGNSSSLFKPSCVCIERIVIPGHRPTASGIPAIFQHLRPSIKRLFIVITLFILCDNSTALFIPMSVYGGTLLDF